MKVKYNTDDGLGFVCDPADIEQFYHIDLTHTVLEFDNGTRKVVVNNDMQQVAGSLCYANKEIMV
jgi:hypothetical protein